MFDFLTGFDVLGIAAILGGLALLGWLVWALLADQDLEELNHRHRGGNGATSAAGRGSTAAPPAASGAEASDEGAPRTPNRRGRAA